MLVYTNTPEPKQKNKQKSHRTLMRTERSSEKVVMIHQYSQSKQQRRKLQYQYKGSSLRNRLFTQAKSNSRLSHNLSANTDDKNSKSRSFGNLFKNAHKVFSGESFLPKKKKKDPFAKTLAQNNSIRQTYSAKIFSQVEESSNINEKRQSVLREKSKKSKTITYEDQDLKYKKAILMKKVVSKQSASQKEPAKKPHFNSSSRIYSKIDKKSDENVAIKEKDRQNISQTEKKQIIFQVNAEEPANKDTQSELATKVEEDTPIKKISQNKQCFQNEKELRRALVSVKETKYIENQSQVALKENNFQQKIKNRSQIQPSLLTQVMQVNASNIIHKNIVEEIPIKNQEKLKTSDKDVPMSIQNAYISIQLQKGPQEQIIQMQQQKTKEDKKEFQIKQAQLKEQKKQYQKELTQLLKQQLKQTNPKPQQSEEQLQTIAKNDLDKLIRQNQQRIFVKQQHKKEKYYIQTNQIDLVDIQEIQLNTISRDISRPPTATHKQVNTNKKQLDTSNLSNLIPNSTINKSQLKQTIKIKQPRELKYNSKSMENQSKVQDQVNSRYQEQPSGNISVQYSAEAAKHKQVKSSISSSIPISRASSKQFNEISEMVKKIAKWKFQLQMLAQMATFFSQNAKILKSNSDVLVFLRERKGFRWHRLAYLFFKFFYHTQIIFEQYYLMISAVVHVKPEELSHFAKDNQSLKETLGKIEKSVRKNIIVEPADEEKVFNYIPPFEKNQAKQIIEELTGQREGKSTVFTFFNEMIGVMLEQAALAIKSLFLAKTLQSTNVAGKTLRQAIFRILNSCIILQMFRNGLQKWQVQPYFTTQDLTDPSTDLFRQFYGSVINKIFKKQ